MIAVHGAQLFTLEVGEGPDVAVMLHGGPGASHDYLRPQLDDLAEPGKRRLFYYDQRGGGRSPSAPATVDTHVADLERVREHLGLERLELVGYSWGGLLALSYAIAHPDRLERLALISPASPTVTGRDAYRARLAAAAKRPEVEALRASLDMSDRRNRFAVAVAGYFFDPRRALELTPFLVQQRAEEAVWRSLGDYDLRPAIARLSVPALVLHGSDDPIPIADARETADLLGAEMIELPRCGHVPYIEARELLMPPLRRFLGA
jgi:proline iminopeptidase